MLVRWEQGVDNVVWPPGLYRHPETSPSSQNQRLERPESSHSKIEGLSGLQGGPREQSPIVCDAFIVGSPQVTTSGPKRTVCLPATPRAERSSKHPHVEP